MDADRPAPLSRPDQQCGHRLTRWRTASGRRIVSHVHQLAAPEIARWGPNGATTERVQELAVRLTAEAGVPVGVGWFESSGEVATIYVDGLDIRELLPEDPCPDPGARGFGREQQRMFRSFAVAQRRRSHRLAPRLSPERNMIRPAVAYYLARLSEESAPSRSTRPARRDGEPARDRADSRRA